MELPHLIGWVALALTVGMGIFHTGHRLGREEEARRHGEREQEKGAAFYFRGLNYLLTDEPDKAIEEFIKVVRINSETVEIHLSLGNLFRARGEVGRAIRIHQNIIARPNLSVHNRTSALFALAEDYRQGGFVDRAVEAYRRVLRVDPNHEKALSGLQALHENEGRWDLALEVLQRLKQVTGKDDTRREAHIRVQIGLELQGEATAGNQRLAMENFQAAIAVFPGCVEAYRLLGHAQMGEGKTRNAIKSISTLKKTRPSHFFLLINSLSQAYGRMGDEAGFVKCITEAVDAPSASARLLTRWSQMLIDRGELEEAARVLRKGVARYPGSAGIARQMILLLAKRDRCQEAVGVAERCLDHLNARQPVFQCSYCGFKSQDIYWKCPQCHNWDMMEPL